MRGLQLFRSTRQLACLRPSSSSLLQSPIYPCQMLSTKKTKTKSIPHEERTATEPRQNRLYTVRLSNIEKINPSVRLLHLTIPPNESEGEADVEDEEVVLPSRSTHTRTPADKTVPPIPTPHIPPRPMVRRTYPIRLQSGRVQHHLHARRCAGAAVPRAASGFIRRGA